MTFEPPAIPLPRGVAREIGPLWDVLVAALAQLLAQFGPAEALLRGNGPPTPLLRGAIRALGRLERIARYLLIVHAARLLKLDPSFAAAPPKARLRASMARPATPLPPARPLWRTTALVPTPRFPPDLVDRRDPERAPPPAGAPHTLLRLARKMEGLRRLLADADRHARRFARILKRRFVPVRRPKSQLPGPYGAELKLAQDAAAWALAAANTS